MAAHSAPSSRRQLRITALTSIATALAVVGLMFVGSALTTAPPGREPATIGTTTGPVALVDAAAPAPSTPSTTSTTSVRPTGSTTPAVRKIEAPRSSAKPTTTTTKPPRTTTTTADDSEE
ncbi:hypothetical protein [Actinomycetospora soli]|uniref:hypothetical protein n=1 Tax=Actinomycetospora soli TaxID=2893887 RepID=UPI001E576DFE|nr:hypothetical protein [Actinomycetospora soli]MCD2187891.1 hypothetical protein [Actinomycetospora soli]